MLNGNRSWKPQDTWCLHTSQCHSVLLPCLSAELYVEATAESTKYQTVAPVQIFGENSGPHTHPGRDSVLVPTQAPQLLYRDRGSPLARESPLFLPQTVYEPVLPGVEFSVDSHALCCTERDSPCARSHHHLAHPPFHPDDFREWHCNLAHGITNTH